MFQKKKNISRIQYWDCGVSQIRNIVKLWGEDLNILTYKEGFGACDAEIDN